MHLSDKDFDGLMDLLLRLADKVESLVPNVREASDKTLLDAKSLVIEARETICNSGRAPGPLEYTYTRSEMIDAAIAHARLLGREGEYTWADYSKNLGLLVDFVDSKFHA